MEKHTLQKFNENLRYESTLALAWEAVAHSYHGHSWFSRLNETNLSILTMVATGTEIRPDPSLEQNNPVWRELVRLDAKLNLLLDFVDRLLSHQQELPVPIRVRFNALGISWASARITPIIGQEGIVSLFLDPFRTQPLLLPGKVVESAKEEANSIWTTVVFDGLSEQVAELLERLVFRQHRRQIAESRQPSRTL